MMRRKTRILLHPHFLPESSSAEQERRLSVKYIFMDIDGTLFDHATLSVPESAYRAVEAAVKAGHRIFICTGRSCCMLDQVEQVPYEGVVAAAGAYVEVDGRILFEEVIENRELEKVLACCDKLGISYILEGSRGIYMHDGIRNYFNSQESREKGNGAFFRQRMVHGMEKYDSKQEKVYKLCIYHPRMETLNELEKELGSRYHFVYGKKTENYPLFAEVTFAKNNKASGIRKVLEFFHGDIKDAVAVGDSMNDYEMMQECGIGIAMGNADERLKALADYVTTDVDKDGIYHAFMHFGWMETETP